MGTAAVSLTLWRSHTYVCYAILTWYIRSRGSSLNSMSFSANLDAALSSCCTLRYFCNSYELLFLLHSRLPAHARACHVLLLTNRLMSESFHAFFVFSGQARQQTRLPREWNRPGSLQASLTWDATQLSKHSPL